MLKHSRKPSLLDWINRSIPRAYHGAELVVFTGYDKAGATTTIASFASHLDTEARREGITDVYWSNALHKAWRQLMVDRKFPNATTSLATGVVELMAWRRGRRAFAALNVPAQDLFAFGDRSATEIAETFAHALHVIIPHNPLLTPSPMGADRAVAAVRGQAFVLCAAFGRSAKRSFTESVNLLLAPTDAGLIERVTANWPATARFHFDPAARTPSERFPLRAQEWTARDVERADRAISELCEQIVRDAWPKTHLLEQALRTHPNVTWKLSRLDLLALSPAAASADLFDDLRAHFGAASSHRTAGGADLYTRLDRDRDAEFLVLEGCCPAGPRQLLDIIKAPAALAPASIGPSSASRAPMKSRMAWAVGALALFLVAAGTIGLLRALQLAGGTAVAFLTLCAAWGVFLFAARLRRRPRFSGINKSGDQISPNPAIEKPSSTGVIGQSTSRLESGGSAHHGATVIPAPATNPASQVHGETNGKPVMA